MMSESSRPSGRDSAGLPNNRTGHDGAGDRPAGTRTNDVVGEVGGPTGPNSTTSRDGADRASTSAGSAADTLHLKRALGPVMLWGLGVGYVISGEYFGWNIGLEQGGTLGLLAAFVLMTVMYVAFVFSYTEMACAIPRAGGVFVYGVRALGLRAGYLGGLAQLVEFVFATPAIAVAIGSYFSIWFPGANPKWIALAAYVMFTALNIWGVQQAAIFELGVTLAAVAGLLVFAAVTAPHFQWANFTANALPHGWGGALAAIPFAIWFYLAIEGVANAAEEAKNPRRDVAIGFGAAITTLVALAVTVFLLGVGVGGWERIVYPHEALSVDGDGVLRIAEGTPPSDSPLPLALGQIVEPSSLIYRGLVAVGLLGFVASFNGIILAAGRSLFEMGRVGFLPHFIGRTHPKTKTPANALLVNLVVGMVSILFLDTAALITMSALGAVTLYVVSMIALMRLRVQEPELRRPFRTPLYPLLPIVALVLAAFALGTMTYYNLPSTLDGNMLRDGVAVWYFLYLLVSFGYYELVVRGRLTEEDIAHFQRID